SQAVNPRQTAVIYFELALLLITLIAGWLMTLLSLPGIWVMVAATATYAYFSQGSPYDVSWITVGVLLGLAVLAELLEFAAGAVGAAKVGGSKRGALLAIVGSMIGALFGAAAGTAIPIPLVGSVIGAVAGASLGALAGAMLGETWKGRTLGETWKVGHAAFWGRFLGTVAKTTIASAMAAIAAAAALF
ncbi:MAG TPA: DUF456 domain-containing protein, partial [Pirellulales bacterium]|nr:DUF456 domain-containing protein [Pirellulales bacterium]